MFTPTEPAIADSPACGTESVMVLMAQSVPTATAVPCVASLPAGWSVGGARVQNGTGQFWLDSDQAGGNAVRVALLPPGSCPIDDAREVPTDEVGWRRYERVVQLPPALESIRTYVSAGACVTYHYDFDDDANGSAIVALDAALAFQPRADLVAVVDERSGLSLCGTGAPPCVGGQW